MYSAKFINNDNGYTFDFTLENNVIFDIDPLSELDIDIGAAQSYDQIGETVESQAIKGITREIRGVLLGEANNRKGTLLRAFAPRTHGRLTFNDEYYVDCYIKKTPAISVQPENAKFSLMVFCPYPYWSHVDEISQKLNVYQKAFSFPVAYASHVFGTRVTGGFISVYNEGTAPAYFTIEFIASATVQNYGILNVTTNKYIQINDEISVGDTVRVYREYGRIYAQKTTSGVTTDVLSSFDIGSKFYTLATGENILKLYASTNENNLGALISFRNVYTGVYDGM